MSAECGVGEDVFRWQLDGDLAALAELRGQLRDYLAERAVPAAVAADVLLSLQEASKNALRASGGRPVDVAVSIENGSVSVCVSDHGRGFAPSARQSCPSAWQTRGRGLYLMRSLMDSVEIDCSDGATVSMRRRLSRKPTVT